MRLSFVYWKSKFLTILELAIPVSSLVQINCWTRRTLAVHPEIFVLKPLINLTITYYLHQNLWYVTNRASQSVEHISQRKKKSHSHILRHIVAAEHFSRCHSNQVIRIKSFHDLHSQYKTYIINAAMKWNWELFFIVVVRMKSGYAQRMSKCCVLIIYTSCLLVWQFVWCARSHSKL